MQTSNGSQWQVVLFGTEENMQNGPRWLSFLPGGLFWPALKAHVAQAEMVSLSRGGRDGRDG